MAHKTLINGTAYDVAGGATKINGTGYAISGGRTLIEGTGYDVNFGPEFKWDEASWADLNALCLQKKNNEIDEYPAEVEVGKTKSLTVGNTVYQAQLICVDEIPGTMTFFILDYPTTYTFGSTTSYTVKYSNSNVRAGAQDCYNNLCAEVKNIIQPVVKRSSILNSNNTLNYEDTTEYVFVPNADEFTLLTTKNWANVASYHEIGTVYNNTVINKCYDNTYKGNETAGTIISPKKIWWSRDRACYYDYYGDATFREGGAFLLALAARNNSKWVRADSYTYDLTEQYKILPTFVIGRQV